MSQGYAAPSYAAVEIEPDDIDDIVAISSNQLDASAKGKGRANDRLGVPTSAGKGSGSRSGISSQTSSLAAGAAGAQNGSASSGVTGKIGGNRSALRSNIGGIAVETRYSGVDSLDESVGESLLRDLRAIGSKLLQVLYPNSGNAVLRDWDLWGPLLFTITLAILLSLDASPAQSLSVFTGVFVIVSVGSVVVTLNCKLLGGKVSFLQSLCVFGYCLFPLDLAALVGTFVRILWIRLPVCLICFVWSVFAIINFLGGTRLENSRAFLAVYPAILLFFLLSWITLLS